jgi:predicted dehydrogenase
MRPGNLSRRTFLSTPLAVRLPRKVRVALIGAEGHTGEVLNPEMPDVEIVAVAGAPRLKHRRAENAKRYADYREMLDKEKPDVVGVATDDGARAAAVIACAERKAHVFAEKPLAMTMEELGRVRRAVEANQVRISMMLPLRFTPHFLALRHAVESGQIGEVAHIGGQKSYKAGASTGWKNERKSYSGTIPWVGIHIIDLMRWTSGREFVEAAAFQGHVAFPEIGVRENTASGIYRLDNGGTAEFRLDYLRPEAAPTHEDDRLRLAGTKGVVEYQAATGVTVLHAKERPRVVTELPAKRELFAEFLEAVYANKPEPILTADVWRVCEIALKTREAAEKRTLVKL